MPTVTGTFKHPGGSSVQATFMINGCQMVYTANSGMGLPKFTSNNATLTYGSEDELNGAKDCSGNIGA